MGDPTILMTQFAASSKQESWENRTSICVIDSYPRTHPQRPNLTTVIDLRTFCSQGPWTYHLERGAISVARFLQGDGNESFSRPGRDCYHRYYTLGRVRNDHSAAQGDEAVPVDTPFLPVHLAALLETALCNHL